MKVNRTCRKVSSLQLLFNLIKQGLRLWRFEDISWFPISFNRSFQIEALIHRRSKISIDFLLRLLHSCDGLLSNLHWRLGATIIIFLSLRSIRVLWLRELRTFFQHLLICSLLTQLCLLKFLFVKFNSSWQSLLVLILSTFSKQLCRSTLSFWNEMTYLAWRSRFYTHHRTWDASRHDHLLHWSIKVKLYEHPPNRFQPILEEQTNK